MPASKEAKDLLKKEGIVGVSDPENVIRVYVETEEDLSKLPETIMGMSVVGVVTGRFYALKSRTDRWRPAPGGVSIGHKDITAGTLGCVVIDDETGEKLILSNNHVLADCNRGKIGDEILQPGCLPPGEPVITNFGIKQIDKIEEGEEVLGNGKFVRVLKTMKRKHTGKMVRILLHGLLPIELTPEHPVLVIETNGYRNGQEKEKEILNTTPKWKHAKDVTPNDFLLIPRIKEVKKVDPIVIRKHRYYCRKCGHAWYTYNKPKTPVCSSCKSKKVGYKGHIDKIIDVNDPDFGFLIGLFVADGCARKLYISISLTKDDRFFITKTEFLMRRFFGTCKKYTYGNVVRLCVNNTIVADWFKKNCYDQEGNKKLPDFSIYMDEYWIRELLEGLIVGDGKRHDFRLYTVSKILAYQLSIISTKIGYPIYISVANKGRVREKNGKIIREKQGYEIRLFKLHKQKYRFVTEDYVLVKVKNTEEYSYDGFVYNVETEDNTYSVPCVVHNSYDGGKIPEDVIAKLYRYVEIKEPPHANLVDAAVAKPIKKEWVSEEILGIGKVKGVATVSEGDVVKKSGRTTAVTEAKVFDCNATVKVYGYPWGYSIFEDQIVTYAMAAGGDSGSLTINKNNQAVGLLFAGSDRFTVVNKIHHVLSLLNVSFPTEIKRKSEVNVLPLLLLGAYYLYTKMRRR